MVELAGNDLATREAPRKEMASDPANGQPLGVDDNNNGTTDSGCPSLGGGPILEINSDGADKNSMGASPVDRQWD